MTKGGLPIKNRDYWRGRFSILEEAAQKSADRCASDIEAIFEDSEQAITKEIESWYARFAAGNNITLTEARRLLNTKELKEFQWDVKKYIEVGEKAQLSAQWRKQLENASAKWHISRLEAVQLQMQQQIELAYGNQLDALEGHLKDVIQNGYYHTAYEVQKGIGIGWNITAVDQKQIDTLLSKPWSTDNKTFRDRCWTQKAELVSSVQKNLIQGMIRGDSPNKITAAIKKQFGVSAYKAGRLVHTETTYFNAVSSRASYQELDVKEVEIIETLDDTTCEICGEMDGKKIPMSQYEPGVTVPPYHPNCRGTTAPAIDEDILGERAARDADGNVYYVPQNMTYSQWKNSFVDGGKKEGSDEIETLAVAADLLTQNTNDDIIEPAEYTIVDSVQFDNGKDVNDFFYYDSEQRGLMAKQNSQYGKWKSALSQDSKDALFSYTADGYANINDYLRHVNGWESINADLVEDQIKRLDDAIETFDLKETIVVQRGSMQDSLDSLFETYDNIEELSDYIGKTYTDPGFMSTTALHGNNVATVKPVVFDITVPAGKGRGAYINEFSSQYQDVEYEFLVKRGSTFTITDMSEDMDLGKIFVKMVMNVD